MKKFQWLLEILMLLMFVAAVGQMAHSQEPQENSCKLPAPTKAYKIKPDRIDQAKKKAKLIELLRESLADDEKGILDLKRQKEIKKLASELKP